MSSDNRPYEILLAEDSASDAEMVRMALKEHSINCNVHIASNGAEAVELLNKMDASPKMLPLDLCIVDLHLPRQRGDEILKRLRSTERYAQTPVIVMSGVFSQALEDQAAKHAAAVFTKPSSVAEFLRLGHIVRELLQKNRSRSQADGQ